MKRTKSEVMNIFMVLFLPPLVIESSLTSHRVRNNCSLFPPSLTCMTLTSAQQAIDLILLISLPTAITYVDLLIHFILMAYAQQ